MTAPRVSVVLPVRNEVRLVGGVLDAVLDGDPPEGGLEVLVIDGMSEDGTRELVEARAAEDPRVRVLDNPARIIPAALNLGLAAARGTFVVRMDARALPEPDYVSTAVELLETSGAANVGGPQRSVGEGVVGRAAAIATTSGFGVGNARFRFSEREEEVESVYLGAWRRETLEALGGWDEGAESNEDYELNHRLLRDGGRVLLSPRLRCRYRVRESLPELAGQYLRYGRWKAAMLRRHPGSVRWRQLAAPALVAGLTLSVGLAPWRPRLAAVVPAAYGLTNVAASVVGAARHEAGTLPALPAVYAVMHIAWGVGFWTEILRGRGVVARKRHPSYPQGLPTS
ncbi:MAG: glycosyltransferase family 2 protein [Actinomycetota bacterium]